MSLARLYVLRAFYLILIVGGFFVVLPALTDPEPTGHGMFPSMLAVLWVCALIGLRYPLQMLPILLFEFASKIVWLIAYALPQWTAGARAPQSREDLLAVGAGLLLLAAVIPWTYLYRHYLQRPAARWL